MMLRPAVIKAVLPRALSFRSAATTADPAPAPPLCERPAAHVVELAALLAWHQAALKRIAAVGDSWARLDDGPTQEDLATELSWLLDDAVAGERSSSGGDSTPQPIDLTWRALSKDAAVESAENQSRHILLREPLDTLEALWTQRLQDRVPLQYLTSTAFWRDVVLSVGPGVLIPRPETELLIDFATEAAAAAPELARGQWADLGTGSGALAVALARALPAAPVVWAVDLSPAAAAYAAFNASRLGVGGRVRVARGSWCEPLIATGVEGLAGVVSNPPYVSAGEVEGLQAEVGQHEPRLALDGGEGLGVDCLVPICCGAAALLRPGGFLALETAGGQQAEYVADVLRRMRDPGGAGIPGAAGDKARAFDRVEVRKDLRGVERFVTATRAGGAGTAGLGGSAPRSS